MWTIERSINLGNLKAVYNLFSSFLKSSERNTPGHVKAKENEALVACIEERQKKVQYLCIQRACEEGHIHVEHDRWKDQVR